MESELTMNSMERLKEKDLDTYADIIPELKD